MSLDGLGWVGVQIKLVGDPFFPSVPQNVRWCLTQASQVGTLNWVSKRNRRRVSEGEKKKEKEQGGARSPGLEKRRSGRSVESRREKLNHDRGEVKEGKK